MSFVDRLRSLGFDHVFDDYPQSPTWRGDFYTDDVMPPQRRERGTTYWRLKPGLGVMMYYCPDDPTEEHNADFCRHHYPAQEPQSPGPVLP